MIITNDELKDLVTLFNAQDAATRLRRATVKIDGREFTCYETGEIERIHKVSGRSIRNFGCVTSKGYLQLRSNDRSLQSHRLIFEAFHGEIPRGMQVDHIDNDGMNNEISNLRLVTHQQNLQAGRKVKVNSTAQYRGVNRGSKRKNWRARIRHNGKSVHIGSFDTEIAAAHAYDEAAKKYGYMTEALNFPPLDCN